VQYVKRALPTQVVFADCAGTLNTLEGRVAYQAGDALLTGVEGERWPIARTDFERTYEAIPPTRMAEEGLYQKRHSPVDARQVVEATALPVQSGAATLRVAPGDWVVTDVRGHRWVVADTIFRKTYRALES
jgi:PGDYG protein